jgi:hypothetical protein
MDDVREKVGIAAAWNSLEEIAPLDRDALRVELDLKSPFLARRQRP